MRKIVLASHGYLADGLKSSAELILGKKENLVSICAYVDDRSNVKNGLEELAGKWEEDDEVIILTDIFGGSINNEIAEIAMRDPRIHLISGINLQLLIEILLIGEGMEIAEMIEESIKNARGGMVYFNELKAENHEEEF
jgi:fructoselysine and glucoselysine-specific PTS system IIA component